MAEPISRQEMWHFIENSTLVEVMVCVKRWFFRYGGLSIM